MKYVLASLLLFPGLAFAAGAGVRCQTTGSFGPITITVAAHDHLIGPPIMAKVTASGRRHLEYQVVTEVSSEDLTQTSEIKLLLKQANSMGVVVPGGIQGELVLKYEVISQDPYVAIVGETGNMQITQLNQNDFILIRNNYALTGCRGTF